MATYKSDNVSLAYPAETVFAKLSNLEGLGELLKNIPEDQIPADQRQKLDEVRVTPTSISFPGGPAGDITLVLSKVENPSLIVLDGVGTPVPMNLTLNITPLTPDTCEAQVVIDIKIPAMLKPMVNGPLQKMADQFGLMLRQVPMA